MSSTRSGGFGHTRLLAWRQLTARPRRTLLLAMGFGVGVAVMVVLLAVGEAMVRQASQEKLVGGGEVTVLPDGIDLEVLTTGGLGGLFFSIPNARFVTRQVLDAPRRRAMIAEVSPELTSELVYVTVPSGAELAIRATGEIPRRAQALGALPPLVEGTWSDDNGDWRWIAPTAAEQRHLIDHFHEPPIDVAHPESWGEWHYFNVLSDDAQQWAFVSFIVAGDVRSAEWGGQLLVTLHDRGRTPRRFTATVDRSRVRYSLRDADVRIGESSVRVLPNGDYAVTAVARENGDGATVRVTLTVAPTPRAEFPGATLASGALASGYAVPALRAQATGTVCVDRTCTRYNGAQSYHDHNWGTWQQVAWEWGATRAGDYTVLYGRVLPDGDEVGRAPLFVYVTDSLGFLALLRPDAIVYADDSVATVRGRRVRVPRSATLTSVRDRDTVSLLLTFDDVSITDTRDASVERGESAASARRALAQPYFLQLVGRAELRGRIEGRAVQGSGRGFFEVYR